VAAQRGSSNVDKELNRLCHGSLSPQAQHTRSLGNGSLDVIVHCPVRKQIKENERDRGMRNC
jgi:hypothetical protein